MASPTSAREWKKATQGEEIELPSGNVALIKRPGMESLFAAGVLPDELTKIALEEIRRAETGQPQDHKKKKTQEGLDPEVMQKFLSNESAISDIFDAFDRVTEMCVIEPPVKYHKRRKVDGAGQQITDEKDRPLWETIPNEERDEDVVYTDDVDMNDKTFIFNFVVGGTRDIASFRMQFGDDVATLQSGEDVEVPTVGTSAAQ